eukprot:CAMPEP_0206472546 /NCGR_PEP_ID=MMETSP0324_2-20121206/32268_1 /ASSEMBLY_ACC=CAM_ASM_000836 /TAXON_ID=2866 /ORGANISM="Crypthecodinium cohnii, Strain Seligo" /LENGTH=250 /DNA_ID=CAMNT_0053947173 /DNA_START=790 /DNA_END=1542 /DNA_ORIENTATION=+
MSRPAAQALTAFLEELRNIGTGPLNELDSRLIEVKCWHDRALAVDSPADEQEALDRVEACYNAARAAAASAQARLRGLSPEVHDAVPGSTDANLRRQAFNAESARLQNAVTQMFQVQQAFHEKVKRRRSSNPGAGVTAVAAGSGAKAGASGMMQVQEYDEDPLLLRLAQEAEELRKAMLDIESIISFQGEQIDAVESAISTTDVRAAHGRERLEQAVQEQRRNHWRWCLLIFLLLIIIVIVVFIVVEETK